MLVQVSDPVLDSVDAEEKDFDEAWRELGDLIKVRLQRGQDLVWANIQVSYDGRIGFHRTISADVTGQEPE